MFETIAKPEFDYASPELREALKTADSVLLEIGPGDYPIAKADPNRFLTNGENEIYVGWNPKVTGIDRPLDLIMADTVEVSFGDNPEIHSLYLPVDDMGSLVDTLCSESVDEIVMNNILGQKPPRKTEFFDAYPELSHKEKVTIFESAAQVLKPGGTMTIIETQQPPMIIYKRAHRRSSKSTKSRSMAEALALEHRLLINEEASVFVDRDGQEAFAAAIEDFGFTGYVEVNERAYLVQLTKPEQLHTV